MKRDLTLKEIVHLDLSGFDRISQNYFYFEILFHAYAVSGHRIENFMLSNSIQVPLWHGCHLLNNSIK